MAFEQIPRLLAQNPKLGEQLATFVDHWYMDYYDPPENVVSAVRQIVAMTVAAAQSVPSPINPTEGE